jgi:hypothetical protein
MKEGGKGRRKKKTENSKSEKKKGQRPINVLSNDGSLKNKFV